MAKAAKIPGRIVAMAILSIASALTLARFVAPATAAPVTLPRSNPVPAAQPLRTIPKTAVAVATSAVERPPAPVAAPLVIRRVIDTRGPIRYGSYFWDDRPTPSGPLTITIDLKASVLSVFRGGYEVGTTAIIYGADDRETPLGNFPILQKDRHHVSNLYHAPMPYMLRLTNDGVSIHASDIAADYATHGCIGVPAGFARKLFAVAKLGDQVIVTSQGLRTDLGDATLTAS